MVQVSLAASPSRLTATVSARSPSAASPSISDTGGICVTISKVYVDHVGLLVVGSSPAAFQGLPVSEAET